MSPVVESVSVEPPRVRETPPRTPVEASEPGSRKKKGRAPPPPQPLLSPPCEEPEELEPSTSLDAAADARASGVREDSPLHHHAASHGPPSQLVHFR